jgi:UDP-glucose 4-epimerase
MKLKGIKSALIIGMAGNLAKTTANLIHQSNPHLKILGIDSRTLPKSHKKNFKCLKMDYTRSHFEKIFRENHFDIVLLLGRYAYTGPNQVSHSWENLEGQVAGIKNILDLCLNFSVKRAVILSSFHVYGAFPNNPLFLSEDTPLKADFIYPEVRELVEMDKMASLWKERHSKLETVILRPCNIVGPHIENAITKYLKTPYTPVPIDFNPNFQFIQEIDMAQILIKSCQLLPPNIYNVSSNEYITIKDAVNLIGHPTIPTPLFLLEPMAKILKKPFSNLPEYLISYLKFPCLIDNTNLYKALGKLNFQYDIKKTLKSLNH